MAEQSVLGGYGSMAERKRQCVCWMGAGSRQTKIIHHRLKPKHGTVCNG